MAGVTLSLDAGYAFVGLVAAATVIIHQWMGFQVGLARRKYGVTYPQLYAVESENKQAKEFNCVQRGHQQALEVLPQFFVLLFLGAVKHPRLAAALGLIYAVARVFYFQGYASGNPQARYRGGFYILALFGLLLCTVSTSVQILKEAV